jgi:nitrate/TMAO reductase-like tetraheme cytochrome c subunit
MTRTRWLLILVVFVIGGLAGAGALIASLEINKATSTDAFCTSCHSMTFMANDPHFLQSAHRTNSEAVRPSCSDCHIPKTNWFVETYTHVISGVRDVVAEYTHNYSDPQIWEKRRVELAHEVRMTIRAQNGVTCRSCHDANKIAPKSESGRAAHALMREGRMTCIDCHVNLVHAPMPPAGGAAK